MISLGVERGRKLKHVGGAKLDTYTAPFAPLYHKGNLAFRHWQTPP
jgi:hypothetical protein